MKEITITEEEMQTILQHYMNYGLLVNAIANKRLVKKDSEEHHYHANASHDMAAFFKKYGMSIVKKDEWPDTRDEQWKSLW